MKNKLLRTNCYVNFVDGAEVTAFLKVNAPATVGDIYRLLEEAQAKECYPAEAYALAHLPEGIEIIADCRKDSIIPM